MYHVTRSPKFKQEGSTGLYIKLNWEQIERMLMKAIRKINFIYFKCKQDQGLFEKFEHRSNYIKSINAQVNKIYWANAESKGLNTKPTLCPCTPTTIMLILMLKLSL